MNNKGITLTALIITIVLMLILIGVTVAGIFPDITKVVSSSEREKEIARAAAVEEARDEWLVDLQYAEVLGVSAKELETLTQELKEQNIITEEEKSEIDLTGKITIADKIIIFDTTTEEEI